MKGGSFTFADVHLLHDKCQKINPNCEVLYIDTPNWIKKKKKKNTNKSDNTCFQYAAKCLH